MNLAEQTRPAIKAAAEAARLSLIRSLPTNPINKDYATMLLGLGDIMLERFVADFECAIEAQTLEEAKQS